MLGLYSNECSKHSGLKITPVRDLYSSAFVVYTYSDYSLAIYRHISVPEFGHVLFLVGVQSGTDLFKDPPEIRTLL